MSTFNASNLPETAPKSQPGKTSPLDRIKDAADRGYGVQIDHNAEEQRRSETGVTSPPRFGDRVSPAPYPAAGDRAAQPSVPPQRVSNPAGGSK